MSKLGSGRMGQKNCKVGGHPKKIQARKGTGNSSRKTLVGGYYAIDRVKNTRTRSGFCFQKANKAGGRISRGAKTKVWPLRKLVALAVVAR